ncbi:MAG: rod shape-determining protein MreD [Bacteroidetes bacterium]|nr:rod shape-determining protein MreD [Bacteroidota bacterium]
MSLPVRIIFTFIVVILIQVVLLNHIAIRSSINILGIPVFTPLIYPLGLLLLPVNIPHWLLMLFGFITGLVMDMFCNTPGMHAAACVLLCFIRPYLLALFFQQSIKELGAPHPIYLKWVSTHSFCMYPWRFWFIIFRIIYYKFGASKIS